TDSNSVNHLVAGPWNHGGWNRLTGDKMLNIDCARAVCQYFRSDSLHPWFAYYLKDKGQLKQPEALTFETGSNKWSSFDAWPPRDNITERKLYIREKGKLSFEP